MSTPFWRGDLLCLARRIKSNLSHVALTRFHRLQPVFESGQLAETHKLRLFLRAASIHWRFVLESECCSGIHDSHKSALGCRNALAATDRLHLMNDESLRRSSFSGGPAIFVSAFNFLSDRYRCGYAPSTQKFTSLLYRFAVRLRAAWGGDAVRGQAVMKPPPRMRLPA
jgi:hypothetical protein